MLNYGCVNNGGLAKRQLPRSQQNVLHPLLCGLWQELWVVGASTDIQDVSI